MSRRVEIEVIDGDPRPGRRGRFNQPGCGLILMYIFVAWGIEVVDVFLGRNLDYLGVRPREISSLLGIFAMPWLHGGFGHLLSNTLTFAVLGYLMLAVEKERFLRSSVIIVVLSGLGTWLIGRPGSIHIGASALIYGYFGYLLSRSYFERQLKWILFGVVLFLIYGGMVWGVLPQGGGVSWEGHLCGFIAGHWLARRRA